MSDWRDIESAPKDGSNVWVKRMYEGKKVSEGWAVWGINCEWSPMRHGDEADLEYADTPRWLTIDRAYSFPAPTHWKPMTNPTADDVLRETAQTILDTFNRDLAKGYATEDKRYVVDMLTMALRTNPPPVAEVVEPACDVCNGDCRGHTLAELTEPPCPFTLAAEEAHRIYTGRLPLPGNSFDAAFMQILTALARRGAEIGGHLNKGA